MRDTLIILDFGSQYTQLIARRLREAQVFCEIFNWQTPAADVMVLQTKGFILSGGPSSVYEANAPTLPDYVISSGLPILGICYGMQLIAYSLGGRVAAGSEREYGDTQVEISQNNSLLSAGSYRVWMSHGDRIESLPQDFSALGTSPGSPFAMIADEGRHIYGLQFHPEVHHTPIGRTILENFAFKVCQAKPEWTPTNIISDSVAAIQALVGDGKVLAAVSGGVDSNVMAALVHKAIGSQLISVFVDNGLLRSGERESVSAAMRKQIGAAFHTVDAVSEFLSALRGKADPEQKRRAIGETFIRVFENQAQQLGKVDFLAQGTIYPDVIESRAPERSAAHKIKSHHNVGGLPDKMALKLVEPLRFLFKDEVRAIGSLLGLPDELVWRQPFPGPGLAVRCLGEITAQRLDTLRAADAIFTSELREAGLLDQPRPPEGSIAQAFAALLPVYSVGIMGDQRTYQETIVLRAVSSQDFMTADWVPLPHDLLARVSSRIVNEVHGVNRVVYDLTSKPPATIEWE
ncbi:MAG: glutamine-hydrolyzing GMP synthase [Pelolinea sp.]|nr:glutamine-hydrolyzing GMP synthase [Pelolinea sp.]